eukprot:gnl/Ergobibamus_cyprinoides/1413.p1 GENE.gnl/Ergobibamus_cyprinoides/1413~~gnl/Ergobibamus_cyprinoides/1413.p1  ORF type:complete len:278 (+),score=22.92 gnl/Ergobibamus_cyprinoides/1413:32-835(+)
MAVIEQEISREQARRERQQKDRRAAVHRQTVLQRRRAEERASARRIAEARFERQRAAELRRQATEQLYSSLGASSPTRAAGSRASETGDDTSPRHNPASRARSPAGARFHSESMVMPPRAAPVSPPPRACPSSSRRLSLTGTAPVSASAAVDSPIMPQSVAAPPRDLQDVVRLLDGYDIAGDEAARAPPPPASAPGDTADAVPVPVPAPVPVGARSAVDELADEMASLMGTSLVAQDKQTPRHRPVSQRSSAAAKTAPRPSSSTTKQ